MKREELRSRLLADIKISDMDSLINYFISFHRNSSPNANQYHGVETLVFDNNGIKAEMAANVNSRLENVGFRNIGVKERPNLTVLRRQTLPDGDDPAAG